MKPYDVEAIAEQIRSIYLRTVGGREFQAIAAALPKLLAEYSLLSARKPYNTFLVAGKLQDRATFLSFDEARAIAAELPSIFAEYCPPAEPPQEMIDAGVRAFCKAPGGTAYQIQEAYRAMVGCSVPAPDHTAKSPNKVPETSPAALTPAEVRQLRQWAVEQAVEMGGNPDRLPQVAQMLFDYVAQEALK